MTEVSDGAGAQDLWRARAACKTESNKGFLAGISCGNKKLE